MGRSFPINVMALGKAEYNCTKLPLKHLAFTVEPQVSELYPKMETHTVIFQQGYHHVGCHIIIPQHTFCSLK